MLKLTYTRNNDEYQTVTLIGDAIGIRDLYWQLTHNYKPQDGTTIGTITITNLDGIDCTSSVIRDSYEYDTILSRLY